LSRRRPDRKQLNTVVLPTSSPAGRPAALQAALTRPVICSYDGFPAHTFNNRSRSTRSSRLPARPGSGSSSNSSTG
jgi:hypothetical protein